ncbi:MAG: ATP-binding protein, partial [Synergistaceae bacterium]|nr:ATP-binding protein [Synergistaceae bacterium]
DEYDKPILDNIGDPAALTAARAVMRDFYLRVKAADEYLRFVFMTGISKFSKLGVFSAMNNLMDISSNERYSAMLGYTQSELLSYFDDYIAHVSGGLGIGKDALAEQIRNYYDGFSFDGKTSLYNPFSTLCFFAETKFKNYWFDTATPSFLAEYVKRHDLEAESFRGIETDEDFTSVAEIEDASPESFLYQSGYLSVKERKDRKLILDYPNMEVLSSVALLFLREKYEVKHAGVAAIDTYTAFARGDAEAAAKIYDRLLASIPYDIYEREEKKYAFFSKNGESFAASYAESFYHAVLFAMLWASGIHTVAENHSYWGRSDIDAETNGIRYVIELKTAEGAEASERAAEEGMRQIKAKGYADKYEHAVLVSFSVDRITRRLGASRFERF